MLDSTGKLYEKMILNRMQSELDDPENEGLLDMKYGFLAGRSTSLHFLRCIQSAPSCTESVFHVLHFLGRPLRSARGRESFSHITYP